MSALRSAAMVTAIAAMVATGGGIAPAMADGLSDVKARGVLKVGAKADYAPFGFKEGEAIVGLEPDLAADVASRLGVKLELLPVVSANRMEFLRQGQIDLMIATMSFRPERDMVVGIVRPFYYASAQAGLAPKSAGLTAWESLRGQTVCGVQGAYYNRSTEADFGAKILNLKAPTDALAALKEGRCVAFAYDSTYFVGLLRDSAWTDYAMSLPQINSEPWGLAVKKDDTTFIEFMTKVVEEWHRSGKILELEAKWGIPISPYAKEMHEKYKG